MPVGDDSASERNRRSLARSASSASWRHLTSRRLMVRSTTRPSRVEHGARRRSRSCARSRPRSDAHRDGIDLVDVVDRLGELLDGEVQVVGVDEVEGRAPDDLVGREAEHLADDGRHPGDGAVDGQRADDVRARVEEVVVAAHGVDERAEPRALGDVGQPDRRRPPSSGSSSRLASASSNQRGLAVVVRRSGPAMSGSRPGASSSCRQFSRATGAARRRGGDRSAPLRCTPRACTP